MDREFGAKEALDFVRRMAFGPSMAAFNKDMKKSLGVPFSRDPAETRPSPHNEPTAAHPDQLNVVRLGSGGERPPIMPKL